MTLLPGGRRPEEKKTTWEKFQRKGPGKNQVRKACNQKGLGALEVYGQGE